MPEHTFEHVAVLLAHGVEVEHLYFFCNVRAQSVAPRAEPRAARARIVDLRLDFRILGVDPQPYFQPGITRRFCAAAGKIRKFIQLGLRVEHNRVGEFRELRNFRLGKGGIINVNLSAEIFARKKGLVYSAGSCPAQVFPHKRKSGVCGKSL